MRFFHLLMFILIFNASVSIIAGFNIFPTNQYASSNYFNTTVTQSQGLTQSAPNPSPDITGFGYFIWGPFTALNTFINLIKGFFMGFTLFLANIFQCTVNMFGQATCSYQNGAGVASMINTISLIIYVVMAIGTLEIITGRNWNF